MKHTSPASWALSAALLLCACGGGEEPAGEPGRQAFAPQRLFDASRALADVRAQVEIGPRPAGSEASRREVALILARLRGAGLDPVVQHPHRNVVATIRGDRPGTVVIGAHHDTRDIPGFVGANDGASGVAVLLELARLLGGLAAEGRPLPAPSITLVFFDAEEARGNRPFEQDGLRGSRQFVRLAATGGRQGSPPLRRLRAMYLLDMVGDCDLAIPREANSSPELYRRLEGPAFGGETAAIADDHLPFREAGIPAVDLIDFSFGPGPAPGAWWHTPRDTLDKVCGSSLRAAGTAVLVAALGTL